MKSKKDHITNALIVSSQGRIIHYNKNVNSLKICRKNYVYLHHHKVFRS